MAVVAPKLKFATGAESEADPYNLEAVLPSILDAAAGAIPADAYAVWLRDPGGVWRVAAGRGLSDEYARHTVQDDAPISSDPIYSDDISRSPILETRNDLYRREGIRALMAMPLRIREEHRGTLAFYFRQPHKFTQNELDRAAALARLAGSALATAELYHEQLRDKQRADFILQAGAVLASSLDYEKTLPAVARLAVPYIADWCAVDVVQEDGTLKRLSVAHVDPARVKFVQELQQRFPAELRYDHGIGKVIASGLSELYPAVTDQMLQQSARSAEHLEILRSIGIRSALLVPLKARNQVLGAMTFITADSGRHLGHRECEIAEELAARASTALDNARLFGALQQSEKKFRAVSESAACAVFIVDGMRFLYANQAAENLIGYTLEEFGNADMWELVHPDDRELVQQRALAKIRGEAVSNRQELRVLRRDGTVLWLDVSMSAINYSGRTALIATAFDITVRKAALQQLERRELEARTLLNAIPDYIARFDRDLRYMYKSSHLEYAAPMPASKYIGKTFRELGFAPETCEVWEKSLRRAFDTARPHTIEYSLSDPAGKVRHYIGVASPEVNGDGTVETVMTITRDVTDQRNAAERLRRSEAQLRIIIDSMPGLVAYIDSDQIFRRVNRTFEQWFLAPVHSFVGKSVKEVLGPQSYRNLQDHIERALRGELVQYETTNDYPGGTRRVLITYVPDFDDARQPCGFVALVMDVTERHKAEEALRKTEKLAAAGRLAASIAHEINNPLESVTNLLFLLRREPELSEPGRQYLSMAEEELARVSHIATQTLRFHRQSTRPVLTNMEEVIDAVEALYQRRLVSSGVTLEKRYAGVPPIHALEGEVRQLLANLIGNALDATPAGGRIVVRTRRATTRDGRRGVQISIADTGHGIPRELLTRIYEPFVTTKGTTGTGLGLWVSREIVEKHQGTMRVRSKTAGPQTGTVFTVFLADLVAA